jgi:MYXO-CTERM domain-containing protein
LADALASVVTGLGLDACCVLDDCAAQPEPPDPHPVCGDGRVQGSEVCDDGTANATYGHCGGRCDGPHLYCGDGRIDGPETCDDGNTEPGDGCNARCTRENEDDAGDGIAMPTATTRPPLPRPSGKARPAGNSTHAVSRDGGLDGGASAGRKRGGGCGCSTVGAKATQRSFMPMVALSPLLLLGRRYRRRR